MLPTDSNIRDALRWAKQRLASAAAPIDNAQREAEALLAHCLGLRRTQLLTEETALLLPAQSSRYSDWIERRAAGEPFAYLIGERDFWSLTLRVTPDVLVPRPETELLVERALLHGADAPALRVADLGTGSGCIALALAHERPRWAITATDQSAAALAVARDNAQRLGLANLRFGCGDWYAALGAERQSLLISNPPYIGTAEPELKDVALRHEPQSALTPGDDGLAALRALAVGAPAHLEDGGWLLLEHGASQAAAVRAMLVAQGFSHVTSQRDLAGIERVTEGRWRHP